MDDDRFKLYMLLAGQVVWEPANINILQGLDWKRALALYLCYGCGLTGSIREVVETYDNSFNVSAVQFDMNVV